MLPAREATNPPRNSGGADTVAVPRPAPLSCAEGRNSNSTNAIELAPGLTYEVLPGDRVVIGRGYWLMMLSKQEAIGLGYCFSELVE